ncbi:MAG: hypothetical protein QOE70_4174 [Chthoniobacter sp.]|jgi:hypothetical protein|nr:hypothetical protein [Chthoniobacter sp.]
MSESRDPQPNALTPDLDARVTAVEQYLAAQEQAAPAAIEFAGGTIVHIPHVGSFSVRADHATQAAIALVGLVAIGAVFLFLRRCIRLRD